jgi:hypothetical protein
VVERKEVSYGRDDGEAEQLTSSSRQGRLGDELRKGVLSALEYVDNLAAALHGRVVSAIKRDQFELLNSSERYSRRVGDARRTDRDVGESDEDVKKWCVVVGSQLGLVVLLARCQLAHELKGYFGRFLLLNRRREESENEVPLGGRSGDMARREVRNCLSSFSTLKSRLTPHGQRSRGRAWRGQS